MYLRATVLAVMPLLSFAALAQDDPPPTIGAATMCTGKYALCIKAPCTPVVTYANGTFSITEANCTCDVLVGNNMGPGDCDSRAPVTSGEQTYLISTYSNFYNKTNLTLSCPDPSTMWAWCYGSPCVVDEKDPSKATCTCPVKVSAMFTLGGGCKAETCDSIWSAATLAENEFANNYFYNFLTSTNAQPAPNPPAKFCPGSMPPPHPTPLRKE